MPSQPEFQNIKVIIEIKEINLWKPFKFGVKEGTALKDIKHELFRQGSKIALWKRNREFRKDYEVTHQHARRHGDEIMIDFALADNFVFLKDNEYTIDDGPSVILQCTRLPPTAWNKLKLKIKSWVSS